MRFVSPLLILLASPAAAEPRVVADIGPVHSLVSQVMEGVGTPELLVSGGADPHSFQLRPSQRRALAEADILFWTGEALEPWLADLAGEVPVSAEMEDIPGLIQRPPMFAGDHHEEDRDEHEGQDHDDDYQGHDHGDADPHIWLDPANGRAMLAGIAETLASADPANAAQYRANAAAGAARLDALQAELETRFARHREARLVVFHDAYAHLAGRFGLTVVGALAQGDAADPGAATVAELRGIAASGGIDCALAEPQHSDAILRSLAEDAGVPMRRFDPEGTTIAPGPALYSGLLVALTDALDDCLAGG